MRTKKYTLLACIQYLSIVSAILIQNIEKCPKTQKQRFPSILLTAGFLGVACMLGSCVKLREVAWSCVEPTVAVAWSCVELRGVAWSCVGVLGCTEFAQHSLFGQNRRKYSKQKNIPRPSKLAEISSTSCKLHNWPKS